MGGGAAVADGAAGGTADGRGGGGGGGVPGGALLQAPVGVAVDFQGGCGMVLGSGQGLDGLKGGWATELLHCCSIRSVSE